MFHIYGFNVLKRRPRLGGTVALLMNMVLVGCIAPGSGPGVSRYEPTYLRVTEEQQFARALRQRYLELATNAFDRGDIDRSDFYSLRALMAVEGKLAQPSGSTRKSGEIGQAAKRLELALGSGARIGSPELSARAQAAYDCWLVESEAAGNPEIIRACRFNALQSLAQLEAAGSGARLNIAGGPVEPETFSYVIEPGQKSKVIEAPGGYKIEIVTEQVEAAHAKEKRITPATSRTSQPRAVNRGTVTGSVQPARILQQNITATVPSSRQTHTVAPLEPIASGNVYRGPIETVVVERTITTRPLPPVRENARPFPPQTSPVFDTRPVRTVPVVDIASFPSTGSDVADALILQAANTESDFSVFFGFDSDAITLEGEDILIDVIESIRLKDVRVVTLMGFTDSVGDVRYNQLLAMRRAQSVRQFLQQKIDSDIRFEILPIGELQAVRNGGDGVKEALNRKVEIGLR